MIDAGIEHVFEATQGIEIMLLVIIEWRLIPHAFERRVRIAVEFVLEDPEYLAEPLTHRRELMYSPHEEMYRFNCDPEATSRFVR